MCVITVFVPETRTTVIETSDVPACGARFNSPTSPVPTLTTNRLDQPVFFRLLGPLEKAVRGNIEHTRQRQQLVIR